MSALAESAIVRTWRRAAPPSNGVLAIVTLTAAIVLPAFAYAIIGRALPGSIPVLQYVIATAYVFTAGMTLLEARAAMSARSEPPLAHMDDPAELAQLPSLTAIISAYLPNERDLVVETIVNLATRMRTAPGKLQIILAYNTPQDIPDVEGMLSSLAELHVAFTALRVVDSTSKAENINAALPLATGEVTLLLDADHLPAPDAAVRALRWFDQGYDIVQGRCEIRDWDANWLSRIVAVEFEEMYSVAHAGRSLAFDTAMFCGTNGWWRTSVLRRIGMSSEMLTEDIDSSVRALLAGYRTIHDRSIVSTELPPPNLTAWWGQRTRWAQGWFQVTLKHQRGVLHSAKLTSDLKWYWSYVLSWRQLFPVLSLQIFALLLADLLLRRKVSWLENPYLVLTTILTVVAGPMLVVLTYRVVSEPRRRELRRAFLAYGLGAFFYTTLKNTVAMVATVRELIGQRAWVVTRRALPVIAVVTAGLLPAIVAPGARAATDGPNVVPLATVATSMTMTGRVPITYVNVELPAGWTSVTGTLHLRWQAAPTVTDNSSMRVSVGNRLVAAAPVAAGVGTLNVPISQAVPGGHFLQIELEAQLHTKIVPCCVADPGTTAILDLSNRSSLTLSGHWSGSAPLLADAPSDLANVLGPVARPLYVALPAHPAGADVRAAAVLAGAIDRANGVSAAIKVLLGAKPADLRTLPGNAIDIDPGGSPGTSVAGGTPSVSISRRPNGLLTVTLTGNGETVLNGAVALARHEPGFYPGSSATIATLQSLNAPTAPRTQVPISQATAIGTGSFSVGATFQLPESRQVTSGTAHVRLGIGFDAPAGGRVELALNGLPLQPLTLRSGGSSQLHPLINVVQNPAAVNVAGNANATLLPGENVLTITGDLPPGQPVGGSGDAEPPLVTVLKNSSVHYTSRARTGQVTLGLWPWPFLTPGAKQQATFVLPATPDEHQLRATISTIATASLWDSVPYDPEILLGPAKLPGGPVVLLTSGPDSTVTLPSGAPARPQDGLLETYRSGGRQVLVAIGAVALKPLTSAYRVDKVKGIAAVNTRTNEITTIVGAPTQSAFPNRPIAWELPAGIIVVAAAWLMFLATRRARRRLDEVPVPAAGEAAALPADQVELWNQLIAHDRSGDADGSAPGP